MKRRISLGLILILTASIMGCTQQDAASPQDSSTAASAVPSPSSAAPPSAAAETVPNGPVWPAEKIQVKMWTPMHSNAAKAVTQYGEMEFYQKLEDMTNIHIEFIHPAQGQEKEVFNLMIASRDMPDIIEDGWGNYPGDVNKAHEDGLIVSISDYWDKYAPNFKAKILSDPEIELEARNDAGHVLSFPQMRTIKTPRQGLIVRRDWLDDVGLPVPETIDEWYTVLTAFKTQKGATSPFSGNKDFYKNAALTGAFDLADEFYVEDGTVKYGRIQPEYAEYLRTLRKWFEEGLIDPEFASNSSKTIETKFTSDQVGAYLGVIGGGFTNYLTLYKTSNPDFSIEGAPFPTLEKGAEHNFGTYFEHVAMKNGAAISANSPYIKELIQLYDYNYTEQGIIENSFGYEGITYEVVDGKMQLTDAVMKNPEGKNYTVVMSQYNRASSNAKSEYLYEYFKQVLAFPQQQAALETWSKPGSSKVLPVLAPTSEETQVIASILPEIGTYCEESITAFIMGKDSLDNFGQFTERLEKMGIGEVTAIYQNAYERYIAK